MTKLRKFLILLTNTNCVYHPGMNVEGRVIVELDDEMTMKEIRLRCLGYSDVHWSERRKTKNGHTTRHYRNNEVYFNFQYPVLPRESDSIKLKKGHYEYPFSFQLPPQCPSSYEARIGRVRYYLQATIDRPWRFDHDTKLMFTVLNLLDLNKQQTNLTVPATNTQSKTLCCLCCESPPISATIRVDRTGYVPGESIAFSAEIDNKSDRVMNCSKAKIDMVVLYQARTKSRTVRNTVAELQHGSIQGGGTDVWMGEKLFIPPVPPSFLQGCNIIHVAYQAVITVDPSGIGFDLDVPVDIVIGSIPLQSIAQQYGFTMPALPTAPSPGAPEGLYTDTTIPNMPPPIYADSAMGGVDTKEDDDGEHTRGNTTFAPKYNYYDWEKKDPASHFTVKLNENDEES